MNSTDSSFGFRAWLKLNRLIPLLTIIGAGIAIVVSFLGVIKFSIAEQIIITLLALIAADGLTERLGTLARIETALSTLSVPHTLKSRDDLSSVEQRIERASEICIIAVSAISLSHDYTHLFAKKIENGCEIRIILLNPNCPSVKAYDSQYGIKTTKMDINGTLSVFKKLLQMDEAKGRCEVRLLDIFLPFSMFAIDLRRGSGEMAIEYHNYKRTSGENPHVKLTVKETPKWYDFYQEQFEQAWSDANVWTP